MTETPVNLDKDAVRAQARWRWPEGFTLLTPQVQKAIERRHLKHGPSTVQSGTDGSRVLSEFAGKGGMVFGTCDPPKSTDSATHPGLHDRVSPQALSAVTSCLGRDTAASLDYTLLRRVIELPTGRQKKRR